MPLDSEKTDHDHIVLTVGDRPEQARDVGRVLDEMKINFIYVKNGEQGLKKMKVNPGPFSLVICDQRLKGMKGTAFLAKVKEIFPETIRFLITGYSDMETIISAVNKGAVHRYISTPWKPEQMTEAVRSGISRYAYHLENDRMFALAKSQNGKLYELNCELMETTRLLDKESKTLEKNIFAITSQLREKTARRPLPPEKLLTFLLKAVKAADSDGQEHLTGLYEQTIAILYEAFNDLALRNGIEMPGPEAPETGTGGTNA